ncbi:MAG: LPP20 family lipoprotein [Proteobacteria bacterium]|nr:LPP20 family lipoprotein [Pseudomonadota bacterium]MBU1582971.1 LPP20 family lipoprotein [Pseudomonadota bacterium]MBU2452508.1 LPP20 family lipoprotein [Pseudomonadota bacterium]MBU2631764.1 LPP20 family lipoprotein [Pseudomonadota bacterium]
MIRNSVIFLAVLLATSLMGTSCSNKHIDNDVLEKEFENAPKWVLTGHEEGFFSAVGSARIGKSGMQFAKTAALAQGRDELARQLSVKVESLVNNFVLQTGLGDDQLVDRLGKQVSHQVTQNTLSGSHQKDVWISPSSELYVLVFMETTAVKQSVRNQVISSYKSQDAEWQAFKAQNASAKLDREIENVFGK